MAGRKSLYTDERLKIIKAALSVGAYDAEVCAYAGISETTFYDWQKKKPEFADLVTRTRPAGWIEDLGLIKRAAKDGDWRAAAEHLDRTGSPYTKKERHEHTGKDGSPLTVVIERVSNGN